MRRLKQFFKRFSWYKELRYIYRSFVVYKKPLSYIYYRFFIGPKIRKLKHPIDRPPTDSGYSIHLLCSHRDLTMLLWSLVSWYSVVPNSGQVYIHEDGSFTAKDRQLIQRLLPTAKIVDFFWANNQMGHWLKSYQHIRLCRENHAKYIFYLKLIDPYFVSNKPNVLVLDTDVLWFSYPAEIINNFMAHRSFMLDGMKEMEFSFSDGKSLDSSIRTLNSGIVGYPKDLFSLDLLEEFVRNVGPDNPSRVIEQAGYAYLLGNTNFTVLNPKKYSLKFYQDQIARHYTGPVREKFWFEGIKKFIEKFLFSLSKLRA